MEREPSEAFSSTMESDPKDTERASSATLVCGIVTIGTVASLAIFFANCLFAVGNVVSTITLKGINPILFALIREAVAGPLLVAVARWQYPDVVVKRKDCWRFALTGVSLWANNLCYIVGVKLAGATAAGIWQPAQPVFITLMVSQNPSRSE